MKNKLLLLALPALMAMSSCTYLASGTVQNNNFFREDNLAHEDIFGEPERLLPNRLGEPEDDPAGDDPSWTKMPKVGVQFKSYVKDVNDDPEIVDNQSFYAVRYVAAISGLGEGVTAEWTRGVSSKSRDQLKPMASEFYSTAEYDALNNGGTPKSATSEGAGYNKYVVYTMYDIPANQSESYVVAYLALSKAGETTVKSKAVITQINGDNYFSVSSATDGYFVQGDIGGNEKELITLDNDSPNNLAKKVIEFNPFDCFGVFKLTSSVFEFLGNSDCGYEHFFMAGDNSYADNYSTVRIAGEYTLYVNNQNQFGIEPERGVAVDLYLEPNIWNTGDTERYAVCSGDTWISMDIVTDQELYVIRDFDLVSYPRFYLCRMNGGTVENNWGNKWNQTHEISFEYDGGNPLESKFVIDNWSGGGKDQYGNDLSGYHRTQP